jgi:putative sigma-54 modulation protein
MNIIVAGRHIDITEALRARVIEKVGRLSRYFEQVHKAQVWLRVEPYAGNNQVVEVTLWADGVVLRGEEASADMYASIDLVVEKLEKQITKFRGKLIERKRTLASRRKQQEVAAADAAFRRAAAVEEMPTEEGPGSPVRIARRKRFELKPMTAEDAAVQMELLGHAFFVFRNADTLEINVVYRRADGSYGLIEPEG